MGKAFGDNVLASFWCKEAERILSYKLCIEQRRRPEYVECRACKLGRLITDHFRAIWQRKQQRPAREENNSMGRHRKEKPSCKMPGCSEPVKAKGLCDKHYWRQRSQRIRDEKKLTPAAAKPERTLQDIVERTATPAAVTTSIVIDLGAYPLVRRIAAELEKRGMPNFVETMFHEELKQFEANLKEE
jgi:hypothetical protein